MNNLNTFYEYHLSNNYFISFTENLDSKILWFSGYVDSAGSIKFNKLIINKKEESAEHIPYTSSEHIYINGYNIHINLISTYPLQHVYVPPATHPWA